MWLYRQLGNRNWSGVSEDTFGRMWLADGDAHHSLIVKPVDGPGRRAQRVTMPRKAGAAAAQAGRALTTR